MLESFNKAEKVKKPNPELLFTDVYDEVPLHLQKQLDHMKKHMAIYKDQYPLDQYEPMDN